jgi:hypothetical protein
MREKRNAYRMLVGKLKRNVLLGRIIRLFVDNVKMDLGEIKLSDVDWIRLAHDRVN